MRAYKRLASRYFRFAADKAITAEYLERIGRATSAKCWWRGDLHQDREHLFKVCRHWRRQQEKLWKDLNKIGLSKRHTLSTIFSERRATAAILKFLENSDVGKAQHDAETREEEERRAEEWGWIEHGEEEAEAERG